MSPPFCGHRLALSAVERSGTAGSPGDGEATVEGRGEVGRGGGPATEVQVTGEESACWGLGRLGMGGGRGGGEGAALPCKR